VSKRAWFLCGGPCVGKNALGEILSARGYYPISTGELLRGCDDDVAKRIVQNGYPAKDSLVIRLLSEEVLAKLGSKIAVRGAPRTVRQAEFLIDLLKKNHGYHISVAWLESNYDEAMRDLLRKNGGTIDPTRASLIRMRQEQHERRCMDLIRYLKKHCDRFHMIRENALDQGTIGTDLLEIISEKEDDFEFVG